MIDKAEITFYKKEFTQLIDVCIRSPGKFPGRDEW